LKIAIY